MRGFRAEADPPIALTQIQLRLLKGQTVARDFDVGRYTPMILGGSFAIMLGAMLFVYTGVEGVMFVAAVFLAIGLVGAWMDDRRRQPALVAEGSLHGFGTRAGVDREGRRHQFSAAANADSSS
jgi:hypothetical protein